MEQIVDQSPDVPTSAVSEGKKLIKFNPATLEAVGEVSETHLQELPSIIARARQAQLVWAEMPVKQRKDTIGAAQRYIASNMDLLARSVCEETGKPRVEAVNTDLLPALTAGDYTLERLGSLFEPRSIGFGHLGLPMRYLGRSSFIVPRPVGVVGIISPWNYPFGLPYSQTILALAAGNAVVLKPSSETPLTAIRIREVFESSGFPRDLVQVVIGPGSTVGNALVASGVDRLIFTGSTRVGRDIMAMAAQRLTPVTLELGGKDPFIVFEDADLDRAAEGAVWGSFVNAGQTCVCTKRIYVQEGAYETFLTAFRERTAALKLGYGWDDPDVSMGPLINESAVRDMQRHVERALEQGGRVLIGGKRRTDLKGYFFEPTILADLPQSSDAVQEEIFGPIVTVSKFRSEEEAITLANDSRFALSGSVWTSDLRKGRRVAECLSGGTSIVNNVAYTYVLPSTPWGGKGDSGFGRTHGELGFNELLEPHHVNIDRGRHPREMWWQPYSEEKMRLSKDLIELAILRKYSKAPSTLAKTRRVMRQKRKLS